MGVFATCSKDGTANLYVLSATRDPSAKGSKCYILRTFKQPNNLPLSKVLISESPLASIILLTEDLKCMSSFSINGKYLSTYEDITMIENPMVIPDENFNDKLIYGNTTGKLVFLKLPYFDCKETRLCFDKNSVTPLNLTPDQRVLIFFQDGLCCIGDFETNIKKERKELKNMFGFT